MFYICYICTFLQIMYFLCLKILATLSNLSCLKILATLYVNYVELFFTSYYPHISRKDHHTCIIINTPFIPSTSHHVTINTPFIPSTSLIFNAKHIWLRWFYAAANFSSNSGLRARLIGSWPEWKWIIVKRLHLWKNFDEHPLTAKTRTLFH